MSTVLQIFQLAAIGFLIYSRINRGKTINKMKDDYHAAIHSGDKIKALNLGRVYYSKTRSNFFGFGSGKLTTYD
jgi:hypothetical protein